MSLDQLQKENWTSEVFNQFFDSKLSTDAHRWCLKSDFDGQSKYLCSPQAKKALQPIAWRNIRSLLANGTTAHCEYTCHHPPITNFEIKIQTLSSEAI